MSNVIAQQLVKTGQVVFEVTRPAKDKEESKQTTIHIEYDEADQKYKYNEFNFYDATLAEFIELCEKDEIEQYLLDGGEYDAPENNEKNALLALNFILA